MCTTIIYKYGSRPDCLDCCCFWLFILRFWSPSSVFCATGKWIQPQHLNRLHTLYLAHVPASVLVIQPAQHAGRRAYRVILFLVILLPLMYFASLGASAILTYKARDLMAQSRWVDASETLSRAAQLMPTSDLVLITHADLLRQAITQLPRGVS